MSGRLLCLCPLTSKGFKGTMQLENLHYLLQDICQVKVGSYFYHPDQPQIKMPADAKPLPCLSIGHEFVLHLALAEADPRQV